jgi:transcriptional regulator EpsA
MTMTQPAMPVIEPAQPVFMDASITEAPAAPAAEETEALDMLELESVVLNLEHSLRVHAKHHFFSWTQGLLQSLVRHDLLMCALRNGTAMSFNVECFSTAPTEPPRFNELFRRDPSIVPSLVAAWEENHFRPLVCTPSSLSSSSPTPAGGAVLWRELARMGADMVVAHGTHDATSRVTSFFLFACRSGATSSKNPYLVQLAVPYLHTAWMRTQLNRTSDAPGSRTSESHVLTAREQEILKWVYHGKSNYEIGVILEISPLTVKNHVQKILRKLNVQNRTQAVGKAMELRVLNM